MDTIVKTKDTMLRAAIMRDVVRRSAVEKTTPFIIGNGLSPSRR
jgi:hypothetical protein